MRAHKRIAIPSLALLAAGGAGLGLMAMGAAPTAPTSPASSAPGAVVAAASYTADPVHSSAVFNIIHAGTARFWGYLSQVKGDFTLDGDSSTFNFEIPVESVYTGSAKRDEHLKSADFFNSAQFKTITFKSTEVEASGSDRFKVTGDLTMLGETRPVTAEVEKTGEGSMNNTPLVGIEAKLKINRSDWGMSMMVNGGLSDEVNLIVSVEGRER
jgi:polyisoprenoid-binding protein YceI